MNSEQLGKLNTATQIYSRQISQIWIFKAQRFLRILVISPTLDMIPEKWFFWLIRFSLVLMAMLMASSVSLSVLGRKKVYSQSIPTI